MHTTDVCIKTVVSCGLRQDSRVRCVLVRPEGELFAPYSAWNLGGLCPAAIAGSIAQTALHYIGGPGGHFFNPITCMHGVVC